MNSRRWGWRKFLAIALGQGRFHRPGRQPAEHLDHDRSPRIEQRPTDAEQNPGSFEGLEPVRKPHTACTRHHGPRGLTTSL